MNELELTLTLEEVNALLEALGTQPFKQVHQLITKIQTQATGQLQDAQSCQRRIKIDPLLAI